MIGRKSVHKEQDVNGQEKTRNSDQCCMKPSSVVKPSLSLSDSVLMMGKSGLPGRILKLILDEKPVVPSSYIRLAASYSIFSCSACAKNGCLSASVMDRHFAAANTLCLVVSVSSPKISATKRGLARIRCRNIKYALRGFFGAFGSFMLLLRDFPALRCAARKKILALDVIGSKSAHVGFVLPLPSLLHGL